MSRIEFNPEIFEEFKNDFIVEAIEILDRLDQDLLKVESEGADSELINSIFRAIHTVKGTSGSLGLAKLESISHTGENLLSLLREGELTVTQPMVDTLLTMSDALREIVGNLERGNTEGGADFSALVAQLDALQSHDAAPALGQAEAAQAPVETEAAAALPDNVGLFDEDDESAVVEGVTLEANKGGLFEDDTEEQPDAPEVEVSKEIAAKQKESEIAESAIRVDVGVLDKLMNLVGELVLARNQILQVTGESDEHSQSLINSAQRLNLITSELQEGIMKTRMQTIGRAWTKFPRIVRDTARELNKKIRLEMEGKSTELDRTVLEAIRDPLTHLVRNSLDHGIETSEERLAMGKSEEGLVILRAYHEGGQVNIEIVDDGKGVDLAKVRQKAIDNGIISPEAASRMKDREIMNLIFLPGFSTAKEVTNISGRGVGMDVVRTNIEKIGGSIDLQSEPGFGSTIRIKIPLTLAIIPALTITSGDERFAIP